MRERQKIQVLLQAGRLREKRVRGRPARARGDVFAAAQQGLAGVAGDLSDGVEEQEAQPLGSGAVQFLG